MQFHSLIHGVLQGTGGEYHLIWRRKFNDWNEWQRVHAEGVAHAPDLQMIWRYELISVSIDEVIFLAICKRHCAHLNIIHKCWAKSFDCVFLGILNHLLSQFGIVLESHQLHVLEKVICIFHWTETNLEREGRVWFDARTFRSHAKYGHKTIVHRNMLLDGPENCYLAIHFICHNQIPGWADRHIFTKAKVHKILRKVDKSISIGGFMEHFLVQNHLI